MVICSLLSYSTDHLMKLTHYQKLQNQSVYIHQAKDRKTVTSCLH